MRLLSKADPSRIGCCFHCFVSGRGSIPPCSAIEPFCVRLIRKRWSESDRMLFQLLRERNYDSPFIYMGTPL